MTTTYVALLRGINVGGRNRILMVDLRACFESAGYLDVRTYIQSGNVVFRSGGGDRVALTEAIERSLAEAFDYGATVVIRDLDEMRAVVEAAPHGFGTEPDTYRYDVIVRHEAPLDRAGCRSPPPACRSRLVKLGAV